MSDPFALQARPHLAVGPETPGWGSWEWVGADLVPELGQGFETGVFGWDSRPNDELLLVVKDTPISRHSSTMWPGNNTGRVTPIRTRQPVYSMH